MRKTIFIALVLALLQPSNFFARASIGDSLKDCRKFGNNSPGVATRFEDGGHIQDWSNFLKPEGTIKTLIIPIDFPDAPHITSLESIVTFGSKVSQEFTQLSNSKVNLEVSTTSSWIRMPRESQYYLTSNWTKKINDALDAANSEVDFSRFDLVLIKVDEKNSPIDGAGALPMWNEHLGDGIKVLRGAFLGNDYWTRIGQGVQVAVHEIGHVFGLADLYQQNTDGSYPVGIYDLMSTFRLQYKLNLLGWSKWKLGWVDERKLKCISFDSPILLKIPISKSEWNPVFMPYEDKVIGVELWSDNNFSNDTFALIYVVSPQTYVWASGRKSGTISPIQLLKPWSAKGNPERDPILNLSARFSPGDFTESYGQKFKFLGKGLNNFYISITPTGAADQEIPLEDRQKTTISKFQIVCKKGKTVKTITSINPKCPTGYKKAN